MSEIRSVSVRLDADVAGYIAKMKLAGAATDQAFSGADTRLRGVNTQLSGVETSAGKAERAIGSLDRTVSRSGNGWTTYTRKLDGFVKDLVVLPGLALGAVAALQPLAVAGAGLAAAFAPPVAFAGGGLGLFAILGGFAVKETNDALKNIDTLQKKLGTLTKGTKEYADAQKQLRAAQKDLTPAQREYSRSLDDLHESFDRTMGGKSGTTLLAPISAALELAAGLLPKVQPIIKATSDGLVTLIGDLDKFSQTNKFSRFVHDVADQIGPDLVIGGRALGHFTEGIGNLLVTAGKTPAARGLLRELGHLGDSFASWSSSKQGRQEVQGFFRYFHQIGPDVASTIGHVADAVGHISRALAPIGPVELRVISGIASAIASIPIPVLTALAGAATGLAIFQKVGGFKLAGLAGKTLGGGGPLGGVARATGAVPVIVTNWPGAGLPGPGGPGGGGAPGPGGGAVALGLAAIGGGEVALDALSKKIYGNIVGNVVSLIGRNLVTPGAPDPAGLKDQLHLWKNIASTVAGIHPPHLGDLFGMPGDDNKPTGLPQIKALGTAYDALKQHAANASRAVDQVGPRGANAAHHAAAATKDLSAKLNAVDGGHASRAFDVVGHSAAANSARAGSALDNVKGKLNSIPSNKNINVNANTGQSLAQLRAVAAELNAIRSKTITLTTQRVTGGRSTAGLASGGYVAGPGGPRSDSIPAWLSNGEFVVNAAATASNLSLLHSINARGYADGGVASAGAGTGNLGGVRHELDHLRRNLHDVNKELDKQRSTLQNLRSSRSQLVSSVAGNFRSDIFNPASPWGAASDPLSVLRGDIKGARQYRTDIRRLRRRGLHGAAIGEITTLAEAEQIRHMSDADLRKFQRLIGVRNRQAHAAGVAVGDADFGRAIAAQSADVHESAATLRRLEHEQKQANQELAAIKKHTAENARKTGQEINGASSTANRRTRR
jgi:hypothetical protein